MNGHLWTCSSDVFPQSRSISDAETFVSDLFLKVVIQYLDLCLMITLCEYGAP